jgi:hypothetical protein
MSLQDLDKEKDKEKEKDNDKSIFGISSSGSIPDLSGKEKELIRSDNPPSNVLSLQLGDVIRIIDPTNDVLNGHIFMIDYIDNEKIRLIDNEDLSTVKLNINEEGIIEPGSIQSVDLLYRNSKVGYIRQNGLLTGKWINIFFGGDIPIILTGEITNVEEDMIELKTYPENQIIYINFGYKGIPEELQIKSIEIRTPPQREREISGLEEGEGEPVIEREREGERSDFEEGEIEEADGDRRREESEFNIVPQIKPISSNVFVISADELQFGKVLGSIKQKIDVDVSKQRFTLEMQTNDMLNEMLLKVPITKRNWKELNNIHTIIERFKQLRQDFSLFDNNGNVLKAFTKSANWKPLANDLKNLKTLLYWIIPVVKNVKKVYDTDSIEEITHINYNDVALPITILEDVKQIKQIIDNYKSNEMPDGRNKYVAMMNNLNANFTPFEKPQSDADTFELTVVNNIHTLINNLDNFDSSVVKDGVIKQNRFVIENYNTNLTWINEYKMGLEWLGSSIQYGGNNKIANRVNITNNDMVNLTSLLTLPEPTVRFSRINLPTTDILERANLNINFLNYWELLKKNTSVNNVIVDGEMANIDDILEITENESKFVNNIKNYIINYDKEVGIDKNEYMTQFLNKVVPKTILLFKLVKKYIKGRLSINSIVGYLEPFLIYTNDLTFNQYKEITKFLDEEISKYNIDFLSREKSYRFFFNKLNELSQKPSIDALTNLISVNKKVVWKKAFSKAYNVDYWYNEQDKTTSWTDPGIKQDMNEILTKYLTIDDRSNYSNDTTLITKTIKLDFTNSELLTNIIKTDFGNTYMSGVSLENASLMLSQDITEILEKNKEFTDKIINSEENNNKCKSYIIAKQYKTEGELKDDDGRVIYFDKKFDNTDYNIFEDKNGRIDKDILLAQNTLTPKDYNDYIIDVLQKKYKYTESDAIYMGETITNNYKKVVDGNVAVILNKERGFQYYTRENNRWELDESISPDMMTTNQNMLCNFQNSCIEVEKKYNARCESDDLNKAELKKEALEEMVDEFNKNYKMSKETLDLSLNKKYNYDLDNIDKIKQFTKDQMYKYNKKQYNIGIIETKDTKGSDSDSHSHSHSHSSQEICPFRSGMDLILSQSDFIKKQNDIIRFALKFTRVALTDNIVTKENDSWRYCIQTNTKLLPSFLYELAVCYIETPDNYDTKMDEIIKREGKLSDDGNDIVSVNGGFIIRKREFDVNEGFDDNGRIINTREVLEKDAVLAGLISKTGMTEGIVSILKIKQYDTPELRMMANVIHTLSENMQINIDHQKDFIAKIFNNTLPKALMSEKAHTKKTEEMAKKGKRFPTYKEIYNETIMYLILSSYLVGIQSSIPSLKTKKTFPGCVRSFEGFPFDGVGNNSAIDYLTCVAYKLKSKVEPWSALLGKRNEESVISKNIKIYIETYFLNNDDIIQQFKEKTQYLMSPEYIEDIPKEYELINWTQYLPPLSKIKINRARLLNITAGFKAKFLNELKTGSKYQRDSLLEIESKIIIFSLGIQELIQNIIDKKELLLKNSAQEPFLENSCCNENENRNMITTIQYFEKEDNTITTYNTIVKELTNIIYDVVNITKATYLFCKENSKSIYPVIGDEFSEENIYRSFISLCKFNSVLVPLDADLLSICKNKPDFLNSSDSIFNKIKKLKEHDRIYTNSDMLRLLQLVSKKNIIHLPDSTTKISPILKIQNILKDVKDSEDEKVIPKKLIEMIEGILDTYDVAITEDTREMRELKNYLGKTNEFLRNKLTEFINGSNLKSGSKRQMIQIMENIVVWSKLQKGKGKGKDKGRDKGRAGAGVDLFYDENDDDDEDNDLKKDKKISDDETFNLINFLKAYFQNFLKTFPNIILNKVQNGQFDIKIQKYLKLAGSDEITLINNISEYYEKLRAFYDDEILTNLLITVQRNCSSLLILINSTPYFNEIKSDDKTQYSIFDKQTSLLLFENYFLMILNEFIKLGSDVKMLLGNKKEEEDENILQTVDNLEDEGDVDVSRSMSIFQKGDIKQLKNRTIDLLQVFLIIMNDHKSISSLTYKSVMDYVYKTQEREKNKITDKLKALSDEERTVNTVMKISKLGDWGKGLQKSLFNYDKDRSDEERDDQETQANNEKQMLRKQFNDMGDFEEDRDADNFEEGEDNIRNLTEEYYDGNDNEGDGNNDEEENYGEYE